jgi:CheY-specific phosphatase CheX
MNPQNPIPNFDPLLFQVAEATFGELAFMLVVPEELDETAGQPPEWGYAVRVDFTGPFNGELYAAITREMLEPLAANMLGIDPDEDPPDGVQLQDALKELINVVCGNLLPAIAGDEVVFQIGGPELLESPQLPCQEEGRVFAGQAELTLDSGRARLHLFIEAEADVPQPAQNS